MEALSFYRENGIMAHTSGLFRKKPRLEPRLCTAVLAMFNRSLGRKCKYSGEYSLENAQEAVFLEMDKGNCIIIWNNSEKKQKLNKSISATMSSETVVKDWEGNKLKDDNLILFPKKAYYIFNVDKNKILQLPKSNKVLTSKYDSMLKVEKNNSLKDIGILGTLFNSSGIVSPENGKWIDSKWEKVSLSKESKIGEKTARFMVAANNDCFELMIEVTDNKIVLAENAEHAWKFDSIQFAIDTKSNGNFEDIAEFILTDSANKPILMKTLTPQIGGDLPTGWTGRMLPVKNASCLIEKVGENKTIYTIRLKWTELYPLVFSKDKPLSLSVLVNNNDGDGRDGWLEWGGGIGAKKNASEYGRVYFTKLE
jgi:hypothetical protein